MANIAPYYYVKIGAYAVINGTRLPINSVIVDYKLDDIPVAVIDFPIGRDASSGNFNDISPMHGLLSSLIPMTPITVYVTTEVPSGQSAAPEGKDVGFPLGDFPIFKGYVAEPNQRKHFETNTMMMQITARGEPVGLAGTTSFLSGLVAVGSNSGGNPAIVRLGNAQSSDMYNAAIRNMIGVDADIWENGLLYLIDFATAATTAWTDFPDNNAAQIALDRLAKHDVLPYEPLNVSPYVMQFKSLFNKSLVSWLSDEFTEFWTGDANMWDFLMRCRHKLGFSFVPAIEEDVIAPITPNLGGEFHREIDPTEYSSVTVASALNNKASSYVSSVAVVTRNWCSSNWQSKAPTVKLIGGANTDMQPQGRFVEVEAPSWLIPRSAAARGSTYNGPPDKGNTKPSSTAPDTHSQDEQAFFSSGIGDAFARTILHERLFEHRSASLLGRFRLDIAPGSLVKINTVGELFTGLKDTIWGCVNRVLLRVSAQGAATELSLSHIRSDKEHDDFTTPNHPLFSSEWRGGKLIGY